MNWHYLFCSLHQSMGKLLLCKVKACTRNIFVSVESLSISQSTPCIILFRGCSFFPVAVTMFGHLTDSEASPQPSSARHEICKRQISKEARKTVIGRMQGTVQYSCVLQT